MLPIGEYVLLQVEFDDVSVTYRDIEPPWCMIAVTWSAQVLRRGFESTRTVLLALNLHPRIAVAVHASRA